jgi:hypothetical protein
MSELTTDQIRELEGIRDAFTYEIDKATTIKQLNDLETSINETKAAVRRKITGFAYGKEVPHDKFSVFNKQNAEINKIMTSNGKTSNLEDLIFFKKKVIKPPEKQSYTTVHDSQIPSSDSKKGGKRKSRRNLKNKKIRKTRRKSTRKSR